MDDQFDGGPNGLGGYCISDGLVPHGCCGSWEEGDPLVYANYSSSIDVVTKEETTGVLPTISLTKNNTNIAMSISDSNCVFGPFSVTCSESNAEYNTEVFDAKGNIITGITITGDNNNFYISVPIDKCSNGIGIVRTTASVKINYNVERQQWGYSKFIPAGHDGSCQRVQNKGQYLINSYSVIETGNNVASTPVEWTNLPGGLKIIKKDADNNDIKLQGVELQIKCDEINYNETFITDENGEVQIVNLTSWHNYSCYETSNPYYGYELSGTMNLGNVSVIPGMIREITLTNTKNTGNLKITKKDANTGASVSNIGFKLKDSSGKYIIAKTENEQQEYKGTIHLTGIETTDNVDLATEFITDDNGIIEIYNILVDTYTIEESSVGNNTNYTIEDDNIKWEQLDGTITNGISTQVTVERQKSYKTVTSEDIIEDEQKTIEDGTYEIQSVLNPNRVLDIPYNDPFNENQVELWDRMRNYAQKFYIDYTGQGKYTIRHLGSNKMLDLEGGEIAVLKHIILWPKHDNNNQKWIIKEISGSNGQYIIESGLGQNLVMDLNGGSTDNGTRIISWWLKSDNENTNQRFIFNDLTAYKQNTPTMTSLVVSNQRKYIKLSGNVWEDVKIQQGKEYKNNYTFANEDIKLQGIKVTLKNTEDDTELTTYTNENGYYCFDKAIIDKLDKYYVEFEFDGEIYTTIKSYDELGYESSRTDVSKVQEDEEYRNKVDNSYQRIAENGEINTANNSSQSVINGTTNSSTVNYSSYVSDGVDANSISKNVERLASDLSNDGTVRNVNEFNAYENYETNKSVASTKVLGYSILGKYTIDEIRKNDIEEITDINCGLMQREQVDLSVSTDLENVIVSVNGYTNTYTYEKVNKPENEEDFRLDVKAKKWGYDRKLYASDIKFEGTNTCKVYMTYSITIRNNSNTLSAMVDKLINYHDPRYSAIKAGTTPELNGDIAYEAISDNKYSVTYKNEAPQLNAGKSAKIYIQYELNNEAVKSIMTDNVILENVVEIDEYTTYYGENTYYHTGDGTRSGVYASIDKDSAPGNSIYGDKKTYEDDTMAAPLLTMKLTTNERTITGNVFEDIKAENGLGNGKYDENDRQVGNVIVELYNYNAPSGYIENKSIFTESIGEIAKIYDRDLNQLKDARTHTANDGSYTLAGIVPGQYVLKYTYGNGDVVYKNNATIKTIDNADNYKSTIITSNLIQTELERNPKIPSMWYKELAKDEEQKNSSIAVDDKAAYDSSISNDNNEIAINRSSQKTGKIESKNAYSAPFTFKFEYIPEDVDLSSNETVSRVTVTKTNSDGTEQVENIIEYKVNNINFGIVEISKQDYEITKEVSHIKMTLSNGQVLIDGDPRNKDLRYVKYLEGTPFSRAKTINIEADNEIIVGATVELEYTVTAKNKSDINYETYDYYYFGIPGGNNSVAKLTVSKVVDYLDNNLTYNPEGTEGIVKTGRVSSEGKFIVEGSEINGQDANNYLDNNVIKSAKNYSNILLLENDIASNDDVSWKYKASRIITPSDKLEFVNFVECIEIKTVGTPSNKNTLGNLNPQEEISVLNNSTETDFFSSQLAITSPTGDNRNIAILIITVVSFMTIGGGIYIIKRKVL